MEHKEFTEDIVKGIEKLGDFHQDTIQQTYDTMSHEYEKLMITMGHPDPEQCGEMAIQLFGTNLSQLSALDMGCGTGMVGASLKVRGVSEIVGVDASAGMLEVAKEKNCYD